MLGERVELDLVKPGKEDVPPGGFLADGAIVFVGGGAHTTVGASRWKLSALPTAGGKIGVYLRRAFSQYQTLMGR